MVATAKRTTALFMALETILFAGLLKLFMAMPLMML